MDRIQKIGLSYHDIQFDDYTMPKLFAKQGEDGRAFQFTVSDLKGQVHNIDGLEMAMNIELGSKRDIAKATNSSLEDGTAVFLIEFPRIDLHGKAEYNLMLTDGNKQLISRNGDLLLERTNIFDDGDGGNIMFDLEEFKEALAKQEQYLKDMANALESSEVTLKAAKQALQVAEEAKVHILEIEESLSHIYESEQGRVEAEELRVEVEKARVAAEELRVKAENARVEVEKARVAAETGRVNAENERVESETLRKSNEVTREDNEKNRVSNHAAMQESIKRWSLLMQDWIAAEESRVLSESTRKDLFNQMKKEFDEMMELLGDNPVGNLTQEIQAVKNVTDKHFKSAVIQGDDLVLIREDMTELVVPLELNKYATVKALEELEALLTSTKTQLEMKIGKKADLTYVDEKLLNKANKTYVDEVRAELLLAIQQGLGEAVQVYADIFSLGNSDVNDIILNTGKIGLVLKNITQSELDIWESITTVDELVNNETAWDIVLNNTKVLADLVVVSEVAFNKAINTAQVGKLFKDLTKSDLPIWDSITTFDEIINNASAMNAVANSTSAMNAVANNTTAMNAVANSTTALQTIGDNEVAMMMLIQHKKTLTHSSSSAKSINGLVLSFQSIRNNLYRLVFADGTNGNTETIKYKLSNGQYNVLKQYPKITTVFEPFSEQTVYYYPLD